MIYDYRVGSMVTQAAKRPFLDILNWLAGHPQDILIWLGAHSYDVMWINVWSEF